MAALVVTVSPANGLGEKEGRIGIFPGGATPTMYPAEHAVLGGLRIRGRLGRGNRLDDVTTRFELDVDGEPVSMLTDVHSDSGHPGAQDEHRKVSGRPSRRLARLHRALVRRRAPDPLEPRGDPVRRPMRSHEPDLL